MTIRMPKKPLSPDEFVAGATAKPTPEPTPSDHDRDDLRVQVNAKLPEKLIIQRDWLAARLGLKKQDIIETALAAWVRTELDKLGIES
jgi:predicted PhzF superfamily epimerase YddE/YHI9